jgi:small subunit ribosomal protein S8
MSDPVADMFTRIRNAKSVGHDEVKMPYSKIKLGIAKILKDEGFINSSEVVSEAKDRKALKLGLKYDDSGKPLIDTIKRVSKCGKRIYIGKKEVPKVLNGFGISIISTSKGILSGRDARLNNVGGEILGIVS